MCHVRRSLTRNACFLLLSGAFLSLPGCSEPPPPDTTTKEERREMERQMMQREFQESGQTR